MSAIEQRVAVIERAKRVGALARTHAKESEELGMLAAPVAEALHAEGLLGMWVPRTLRGGLELDPISSLEVIESVSYGDPSAGWVLMAASLAIGTGAAYLKDEAVKELFSGPRFPVIAGQGTRPGVAKPTQGGFNLSGSWSFASGIKHGTHIHTLGLIEGTHEARIFVLPVGKAKLIDNWDVLGLRATGSIDYTTDDVFVPEAYTHVATTEQPLRRKPTCTWRRRSNRYAAATSSASASLVSPGSAIRGGRAASAGACSTSSSPSLPRKPAAPAHWPTVRASKSSSRTRKPVCARRVRSYTRRGATLGRRWRAATNYRCGSTR